MTPFAPLSVQRDATQASTEQNAAGSVRNVVDQPGRPLDAPTRSTMEGHLGYDLSSVRVHTDERAAASARAMHAGAYTTGSHIAFDTGRYTPGTLSGQRLMAHELTHVVQQSQGPVAGTPIGDGVQVSHPSDSFEREAREASQTLQTGKAPGPTQRLSPNGGRAAAISIQRADPTSGQIGAQTISQEVSALSALVSAGAAVASAVYAGRSAVAAERQASAAEDPPTAEPTTGGLTVTDADIPEIKALNKAEDPDSTVKTTGKDTETISGKDEGSQKSHSSTNPKGEGTVTDESGTSTVNKSGTSTIKRDSTAITYKPADTADREDRYRLLNVNQGPTDSADFFVTIRANGSDIKDGGTEPGPSVGYEGGTLHSNASVTFKARAGQHDAAGNASVRLLLGGTNTPPRKTIARSGLFGDGGPQANKNYKVQRFGGAVRFSAVKDVAPVVEHMFAGPDPKGVHTNAVKAGDETTPLVTISLNEDASGLAPAIKDLAPKKDAAPASPASPAAPPAGPPAGPGAGAGDIS
jgi:hypothetical protein